MKLPAELHVSVIDPQPDLYDRLVPFFEAAGASLERFDRAEKYLASRAGRYDCPIVVTAQLPGMSGLELVRLLCARGRGGSAVLVVAADDVPAAVHAMRLGAVDVMTHPVDITRLLHALSAQHVASAWSA